VKNEHIDAVRRQLGISFAAVQKYNREHKDEIEHIKDIFTLKGDYKEKYLALLYMFCSADEDFVKRYREQNGLNKTEYEPSKLLEQYKVLLITALIYNQEFYSMVINDIGFASVGIDIKGTGLSIVRPEKQNRDRKIIEFPKSETEDRRFSRFSQASKRNIYIAAAASFLFIFFVTIIIKIFNMGPGPQINNAWASIIKEPEKDVDNLLAYVPMEMGVRIDVLSPIPDPDRPIIRGLENETADTEKTISYYNKLIRADKKNANLYNNRGIAYTLDGYIEAAIKDFNKAIELDPANGSAYYNRAIANAGKNAETEVIAADFKTAISINPDDQASYYALGVLYCKQYDKEKKKEKKDVLLLEAIEAFGHIKRYKDTQKILDYLDDLR